MIGREEDEGAPTADSLQPKVDLVFCHIAED